MNAEIPLRPPSHHPVGGPPPNLGVGWDAPPVPHPQAYPQAYAALPLNTKNAFCPHTGLRHAHLAKLLKPGGLAAGYVRVVALKEPGARHGKTLFHVGDMLRWLDYLASVQAAHAAGPSLNPPPPAAR